MIQLCDGQLILFEYFLFSSLIYILCSQSPSLSLTSHCFYSTWTLWTPCTSKWRLNISIVFIEHIEYIYFPPSLRPSLASSDMTQFTSGPRFLEDNPGSRHRVSSRGCWMRQKLSGSWWWRSCPRGRTHASCPRDSEVPASWSSPPPSLLQPRARPGWARGWSPRARGRPQVGTGQPQAPPHWSGQGSVCPESHITSKCAIQKYPQTRCCILRLTLSVLWPILRVL